MAGYQISFKNKCKKRFKITMPILNMFNKDAEALKTIDEINLKQTQSNNMQRMKIDLCC
tara:strand:+ start:1194 stop:1370 length:177 start_codon:yes stop_codon:yes gene_type:complete